ncbi:MAG: dihydroneopterin aldolase [Clostridium sp.]|nr:dihydroneopterin aldolase [Clostridium sp.]
MENCSMNGGEEAVTVMIEGLMLRACHGVFDQERRVGNDFRVDLTLRCDASAVAAAEADDISLAVNYADVISLVSREMAIPSRLLEAVARRIGRAVDSGFPAVVGGEVTVTKLTPPCGVRLTGGVSVRYRWSR